MVVIKLAYVVDWSEDRAMIVAGSTSVGLEDLDSKSDSCAGVHSLDFVDVES